MQNTAQIILLDDFRIKAQRSENRPPSGHNYAYSYSDNLVSAQRRLQIAKFYNKKSQRQKALGTLCRAFLAFPNHTDIMEECAISCSEVARISANEGNIELAVKLFEASERLFYHLIISKGAAEEWVMRSLRAIYEETNQDAFKRACRPPYNTPDMALLVQRKNSLCQRVTKARVSELLYSQFS